MIVTCQACQARYNDETVSFCPICRYGQPHSKEFLLKIAEKNKDWHCDLCGSQNSYRRVKDFCRKCYDRERKAVDKKIPQLLTDGEFLLQLRQ